MRHAHSTSYSVNKVLENTLQTLFHHSMESEKKHYHASALALVAMLSLGACFPTEFKVETEQKTSNVLFYPGGDILDDLLIIDGVNYFGKAQYQIDDPLADIGFRFNDGQRVRAECAQVGKDIIGEDECKLYEVYRSDFDLIPEGVRVPRPQMF